MQRWRLGNWIILLVILATLAGPPSTRAQDDPELTFIARLMEQMSPQAKVGQLFLVAFSGAEVGATSDVATLIRQYNVGGVIVSPSAGNIVNTGNTPLQVATLTAALQSQAYHASRTINPTTGKATPFIPLFIAVPYGQEINGMTPLPSSMALGATWKSSQAYIVGQMLGRELAALGINVMLGPSFDVLAAPAEPLQPADAQVFGGDPYWVSVMGQAFVRGLREGSENRVVAVPSHFPGQGTATGQGSSTIDKSLAELTKMDLLPFLQAMAAPAAGEGRPLAEALMVTQVRYRGFSGNIRERTRPLAVDAQAMQALLALPEVKAWRDEGGVLFSDSLGSPALRQYYDPLAPPPYRVAQEAFLAGNDVLILSDYEVIKTTLAFFQDKYSTDLAFQTRVNDAVARILRLKYRLYPGFDATSVPVDVKAIGTIVGTGQLVTAQVAQEAVTRLWPSPTRPGGKIALPLAAQGAIAILTDDHSVRDCPTCTPRQVIATDALAQAIVQSYGTSRPIDPTRVISLRFSDVQAYLGGTQREGAPDVAAALGAANWVVLAVLDAQAEPAATLMRQLLVERPDVLGDKKVLVFSFGAPDALDKAELDRLTAYYGLYSSSTPFIEVAARVLVGDLPASGSLPISLPDLGYSLTRQTEPDPEQFIQILIGEAPASEQATPQPVEVKVGGKLKVRTSIILDRNGHPVPDGTPVTFTRIFSEGIELPPQTAGTHDGVAVVEIALDKIGPLRVRAYSEPALTSYELRVTILENQQVTITAVAPPTLTPSPPPPSPTPTRLPTATPSPTATPVPPWWQPLAQPDAPRRVGLGDWFAALMGIAGVSLAGCYLTSRRGRAAGREIAATRWALWCGGAGLVGYILYGLGAPGLALLDGLGSLLASLAAGTCFAALPLAAAWGRQRLRAKR